MEKSTLADSLKIPHLCSTLLLPYIYYFFKNYTVIICGASHFKFQNGNFYEVKDRRFQFESGALPEMQTKSHLNKFSCVNPVKNKIETYSFD